MSANPLVSILINNYNYAEFLTQAIDSAIAQTYAPTEIIVVDDGSIDHSRQIIAGYGERIVPVLKQNAGQASAFNAGVARSRGDILCFLDSDDYFARNKVAEIVAEFEKVAFRSKPMMVHHPLSITGDDAGEFAGRVIGRRHEFPFKSLRLRATLRLPLLYGQSDDRLLAQPQLSQSLVSDSRGRNQDLRRRLYSPRCGTDWRALLTRLRLGLLSDTWP